MPPAVPTGQPRRARWVVALAGVGGLLFTVGLLVEVRCAVGECPAPWVRRLFELDALGSLPRSFTTAVFAVVAVVAGLAWRRTPGRVGSWWGLVAAVGMALTVAKAVSVHSAAEQDDGRVLTLVVGVALTAIGLPLLLWAGLRWAVPGAAPVCGAMAAYAVAALGLDEVTVAVESL